MQRDVLTPSQLTAAYTPSCAGVNPPYPAATLCPAQDDSIIGSPNNMPYKIRCGWDTSGNAYGNYQRVCSTCSYVDCMAFCDAGSACAGFTWLGDGGGTSTGYGSGNCYFKQSAAQGGAVMFQNPGGPRVAVIKACPGLVATDSSANTVTNSGYTTVTYAYQPTAATDTTIRTSTTIAPSSTYPGTVCQIIENVTSSSCTNSRPGHSGHAGRHGALCCRRLLDPFQQLATCQFGQRKLVTNRRRQLWHQCNQLAWLQPHRRLLVWKLA